MSGVYTKLVQKRVEQSKEPVSAVTATRIEQKPSQETTPLSHPVGQEQVRENNIPFKKSESQKVNKSKSIEKVRKSESQQNDLSESQHSDIHDLSTKTSKRFTTYLTKASLRAIRIIADDEERHDYEVFQEAIDFYLANRNK
jgi:hypothetical protein